MHLRTASILILVLAGLGGLVWLRSQDTSPTGVSELYEPLFPELERSRIRGFRVDNLVTDTQIGVEATGNGLWYVTDPIAYPAELSVVQQVLGLVEQNLGLPADREPEDVGLVPPRVIFDVLDDGPDGEPRRHRLELGARDLGDRDVYVRVDDRIYLTRGNFEAPLIQTVDYFREKRVAPISARSVVEFHRRGDFAAHADEEAGTDVAVRDLTLSGRLTGEGWRIDRPFSARMDPSAALIWTQAATGLRAEDFLEDAPSDLARHGLDPPDFEVELVDERGESLKLIFGSTPEDVDVWRCMRVGFPHVFSVRQRSILALTAPALELLDYGIVRAERERVVAVELATGERTLQLTRADGKWRALESLTPTGDSSSGEPSFTDEPVLSVLRADGLVDPTRVDALLGRLQGAEILEYLPGRAFRPLGGGDASEASLKVTTRAGAEWGGELGRPVETPAGGGLMFRRFGDDLTGVVSEDLALLIGTRAAELWSPVVQDLDVLVQKHLEITGTVDGEERTLRFERNENDGLWYRAGTRIEAPSDFTAYWMDALLHMRALTWVAPDAELTEPIEVVFTDRSGHWKTGIHRLTLGQSPTPPTDERSALDSGGRVECQSPAGRCEARADVYTALRELLLAGE